MQINRKVLATPGAITALAAGGVGAAYAVGGAEAEEQVSGADAEKATSAALDAWAAGTAPPDEHRERGRA